jgi:alpha-amylase
VIKYKLDGIRIDTVPEIEKGFWAEFQGSADVYSLGEVYDGRVDYVASYQAPSGPLTGLLSYPLFFQLRNCFAYKNSLFNLQTVLQQYSKSFPDVSALGSYSLVCLFGASQISF